MLRLKENRRQKIFRLAAALERDLGAEDFGREILCTADLATGGKNPEALPEALAAAEETVASMLK